MTCSDFFELLDHLGWQSEEEECEDGDTMTTTPNQDAMCAVAIAGPIVLVSQGNVFFVNRFGGSLGGPCNETLCLDILYLVMS